MTLIPDLKSISSWEFLGQTTYTTDGWIDEKPVPLGEKTLPYAVGPTPALAILAQSSSPFKGDNWFWAGTAKLFLETELPGATDTFNTFLAQQSLFLDKFSLLIAPNLANSFEVKITIPKWFDTITYNTWRYIGSGSPDLITANNQILEYLENHLS